MLWGGNEVGLWTGLHSEVCSGDSSALKRVIPENTSQAVNPGGELQLLPI